MQKTPKNDTRSMLAVSKEIIQKVHSAVDELNILYEDYEKLELTEVEKNVKKQVKKETKNKKSPEKLTVKSFTEAAILYAIEHKHDPRYYKDVTIPNSINRLRNHLFSFGVTQEKQLLRPIKAEIEEIKNKMTDDLKVLEATAIETQATGIGLLHVLFELFEIDEASQKKLESVLLKKGSEYINYMNKL